METILEMAQKFNEKFSWIGAWLSIVGPMCGTFFYVHHENVHLTKRFDDHMAEIHRRTDELDRKWGEQWSRMNDRFVEADRKFYEILKELKSRKEE